MADKQSFICQIITIFRPSIIITIILNIFKYLLLYKSLSFKHL
jgi:hypothetical protein